MQNLSLITELHRVQSHFISFGPHSSFAVPTTVISTFPAAPISPWPTKSLLMSPVASGSYMFKPLSSWSSHESSPQPPVPATSPPWPGNLSPVLPGSLVYSACTFPVPPTVPWQFRNPVFS